MLTQQDKEYILDQFDKKIRTRFSNLKANYTQENAEKYHSIYENESIENIINNSECVFTEPYYGVSFYKEFVTSKQLPPYTYITERDKVQSYIEKVGDSIDIEQRSMYESLVEILDMKITEKKPVINLWQYMESTETEFNESDLESSLLSLYSSVDLKNEYTEEVVDDFVTESHSVPVKIITGLDLLVEYDEDIVNDIFNDMTLMNESSSEPDWTEYELFSEAVVTLASLRNSDYIKGKIDKITNSRLYKMILESMNTSVKDLLDSLDMVKSDYTPEVASTEQAVQKILTEEALLESGEYAELKSFENIGNIALERATIIDNITAVILSEFSMDYNEHDSNIENPIVSEFINESVSIDSAMDYFIEEYSGNFFIGETFLEFTTNGEASKVVRDSAGTLREEPFGGNKKEDSKPSIKKPKKPEGQGLTSKIQNKGLDMDSKVQNVKSKIGKGLTNLKNAGKAIISAPASLVNGAKSLIAEWDKADENKRKELMLKPGYRSMVSKIFRTAIKYKIFFAIGKLFAIKMWIIKHIFLKNADKKRTLRIRNELAAELDTEIKVCEEKINDANADQNQKEKYKLMRLRDKLVAERTRVRTNSKYI